MAEAKLSQMEGIPFAGFTTLGLIGCAGIVAGQGEKINEQYKR